MRQAYAGWVDIVFHRGSASRSRGMAVPELCSQLRPFVTKGRREGRAPAGTHQNPRAERNAHGVHRGVTGQPIPGLPCAMVWRPMPRSPRSRVPSGLRHLARSWRSSRRLADDVSRQAW